MLTLFVVLTLLVFIIIMLCFNPQCVYASNLLIEESTLSIYQNELYKINEQYEVFPQNYNQKILFETENQNLQIDLRTNKLKGINVGNSAVTIKVLCGKNQFITKRIAINILPQRIFATDLSFSLNNVNMQMNETKTNSLIIYGNEVNVLPTITYSNSNIVTYNYLTGLITANGVGTTIVTAKILTSPTLTKECSFSVTVENSTNITIEIITDIYLINDHLRLTWQVKSGGELTQNQGVAIEIIENEINAVCIEPDDYMRTLYSFSGTGKFKVKITSLLNSTYEKFEEIIIS